MLLPVLQIIALANLHTKATHSAQTVLSHFRRDGDSQTWQPKAAAVQTKVRSAGHLRLACQRSPCVATVDVVDDSPTVTTISAGMQRTADVGVSKQQLFLAARAGPAVLVSVQCGARVQWR
jgi:hypothetical protein